MIDVVREPFCRVVMREKGDRDASYKPDTLDVLAIGRFDRHERLSGVDDVLLTRDEARKTNEPSLD